jgi:hypothetical protein
MRASRAVNRWRRRRTASTPGPAQVPGQALGTRARPWVDRLACAWLIRRFIDPEARFVWLADPAGCHPAPEALRFWLKLGFISFGGPAGQIAIMHTELVERRRWISEQRFLHALNYCMLLPGPEAQQLATYIGWLMHRTWGGIVAGRCSCCRRCSS